MVGQELWRSSGTAAGTKVAANIRTGSASSDPGWLTAYKGEVYFAADDGIKGNELWASDGTANGTRRVKDINPGTGSSAPTWPAVANGLLPS